MNLRTATAWIVCCKEVRENLRDRRSLLRGMVIGPLLAPLVFVLSMNLVISQLGASDQPLAVPVVGAHNAPNLVAALRARGLDPQPPVADPVGAISNRRATVVLVIPPGYARAWRQGRTAQLNLVFDSSQRAAQTPVNRLTQMIQSYTQKQGALRLLARGIAPSVGVPVSVDKRDQSTPQSRAALIFAMVPYFFFIAIFISGMYLAIDLTAGERERQSLEPLFANPVSRSQILVGKLAAISVFSFAGLSISVVAFCIATAFVPMERIGSALSLGPLFALQVCVLMLPLVALLAVIETLVAGFARSFREAQTYLSILMIVPAFLSIVMAFVSFGDALWMYAIPLFAQQIGVLTLLRGDSIGFAGMTLALVSGALVTLAAGWVTARIYALERLAIST